jgi:hypothetical protein
VQDLQYHPKTHIKILFSPKSSPNFTVCLFLGKAYWETWLTKHNPDLEMMSFRFTTNDKNESAIREVVLYRGSSQFIRYIRVMKDPKWALHVGGEQQPFEEAKSYNKVARKTIRDYFTFDDMIRFATNWGCPFDQDEFWASDQPMYCLGHLENDEDIVDWTEWPREFLTQQEN